MMMTKGGGISRRKFKGIFVITIRLDNEREALYAVYTTLYAHVVGGHHHHHRFQKTWHVHVCMLLSLRTEACIHFIERIYIYPLDIGIYPSKTQHESPPPPAPLILILLLLCSAAQLLPHEPRTCVFGESSSSSFDRFPLTMKTDEERRKRRKRRRI